MKVIEVQEATTGGVQCVEHNGTHTTTNGTFLTSEAINMRMRTIPISMK